MPTLQDIQSWRGRTAVDADGEKIGSIEDIYLDRQSGEPEWIAVKTGLLGNNVSFVPIGDAQPSGEEVRVAHDKAKVKDAPSIDPDGELSPEEERRLYEHYGRTDYEPWTETSEDRPEAGDEARETDTAGRGRRKRGSSEDAMTRSEEELRVGTQRREAGRARLRKYVTTEEGTQTVPVQREEARIEREPITDANVEQATSGPEISEAEHEVTLHAKEPVLEKRAVPKERVRLDKDVKTDEETVSDELRKEQIEPEGDTRDRPA